MHRLPEGGLSMNEVDRAIGLALLKRLKQRGLISEDTYCSASRSRFFVPKYIVHSTEKAQRHEDH